MAGVLGLIRSISGHPFPEPSDYGPESKEDYFEAPEVGTLNHLVGPCIVVSAAAAVVADWTGRNAQCYLS